MIFLCNEAAGNHIPQVFTLKRLCSRILNLSITGEREGYIDIDI